jgi:hypothetical protein
MDDAYRNAIGTVESSNDYDALGPVTNTGDRAYGRYQVMGANVPEWTERHLGTRMTPEEFLASQKAQDKVFDAETSAHYKKYGNLDDVTSTWFSGRPVAQALATRVTATTPSRSTSARSTPPTTVPPQSKAQWVSRPTGSRMAYNDEQGVLYAQPAARRALCRMAARHSAAV